MSSPSLRPLIDTCQKCSTSPANHEPRSPANGSFQNPGVCPQAVPSFPSPTPTVLFLALAPFSAQVKYRKPRSSVFLCSQTLRKRLLRRLANATYRNIVGHNMLHVFGHPVATCCDVLGVVGSNLAIFKPEPTTPNTSQHIATGWPNVRNPTMLQYVALACCNRLAGA